MSSSVLKERKVGLLLIGERVSWSCIFHALKFRSWFFRFFLHFAVLQLSFIFQPCIFVLAFSTLFQSWLIGP